MPDINEVIWENMGKDELLRMLKDTQEANKGLSDQSVDLIDRLQVAEVAASLGANLDRIGFIRVVRNLMGMDLKGAKEFADSFKIEPGACATQEQRDRRNALLEARVAELKEQETIAKGVGQTEQMLLLQLEEMGRQKQALEETVRDLNHNIQFLRQDVERRDNRLDEAEDRITTLQEENADLDRKLRTLEDATENSMNILNKNLKNLAKMLFSNQLSNAFSLLLEMLSPKNPSNEPDDSDIPF